MNTEIEHLIFTAYHGELTDAERDVLSRWVTLSPTNARLLIEYANETRGIEIAFRSDQAAQADETIGSTGSVFQDIDCDEIVGAIDGSLPSQRRQEENHLADQSGADGSLRAALRLRGGRSEQASGGGSRYALLAATLLGIAALVGVAFWIGGMSQQPERQDETVFNAPGPVAPVVEERAKDIETTAWSPVAFDSELIHFTNDNVGNSAQIGNMPFGFAAYTFDHRGSVVVEGPALWQMLKGDAIQLFEGGLVARAEKDADEPLSFLIDRTEIKVRGAEFGVYRIGPDTASIIVFEGSVEVSLAPAQEQSLVQTMEAGQIGILQTHLGAVEKQSLATQDDLARFSRASGRLRYRPLKTTHSSVDYRYTPPRSLLPGDHDYPQYSGKARLIYESAGVTVAEVDLATLEQEPPGMVMLSVGQDVDSYILHFDPTGGEGPVDTVIEGMIEFDRPILAVLGSSESLRVTDARYGSSRIAYPRSPDTVGGAGGAEFWGIETAEDSIQLSAGRKRLFFKFNAGRNLDQVRLLVEAR